MVPVMQTRVGKVGNCFAACLASILEVPLARVPDFSGDGVEWLDQVARYLEPLGMAYVQVEPTDPILLRMFRVGDTWHTMEGISERGGMHACVGRNGRFVHDPHAGAKHPGLVELHAFGLLVGRMNDSAR